MLNTFTKNFLPLTYLSVELLSLSFKLFLLLFLYKKIPTVNKNKIYVYISILFLGGIFTNITYILYHLSCTPFNIVTYYLSKIFFRSECITGTGQFFILLCFVRKLSSKPISPKTIKIFIIPTVFLLTWYICRTAYTIFTKDLTILVVDLFMIKILGVFILMIGFISLLILYRNYKKEDLGLLKYHNLTFGKYFLLPYVIAKIFEVWSPFVNPPAVTMTSLLFTGIIYYCARRLLGLRFLNMNTHVTSKSSEKFVFVDEFKKVLGKLGTISTVKDLEFVTKDFLKRAFNIPEEKVSIILKEAWSGKQNVKNGPSEEPRRIYIEKVFNSKTDHHPEVVSFVNENRIIIRDEVEFTNFYNKEQSLDKNQDLTFVVDFLKTISTEIFLPIYFESKIIAYLVVNRDARPNKFYTDVERDEMLIYANYLGSIIYLLTHMNLESLLAKERVTKEDIYKKDRKLELIKKGIFDFLSPSKAKTIGVLTYKNKKFGYCNQPAKDIIKVDLNKDKGLEITQKIMNVGQEAATYYAYKNVMLDNPNGDKIIVSSAPNLEKNNTIITMSMPYLSDLIKDKLQLLKNQEKWDYLLALETTDEGKIANHLLPANGPTILNCKISFFEQAITSKTIFLEMPSSEDVLSFARGIQKINDRKEFEEIVSYEEDNEFLALKLFGINPVFKESEEPCLLEQLNKKGTLLIQNVHLLSLELQKKLLEFITTGRFSPLHSEKRIEADVILICSSNQNLLELVGQGKFLKELHLTLHKNSVWLPSLSNLPEDEFLELAEGLRSQLVYSKIYKNLMIFNDSDKRKLINSRCVSINELKSKIQNIILKKTRTQFISDPVVDPAYNVSDFELVEAARLGKHALKNPKILSLLMRKFKGNQSKVASFLAVNRSTVSRRCTQYGQASPIKSSSTEKEISK